jgi:hypothetical protein
VRHTLEGREAAHAAIGHRRITGGELESMPGGVTKVSVIHEDFQGQTATYTGLQGGGWVWSSRHTSQQG